MEIRFRRKGRNLLIIPRINREINLEISIFCTVFSFSFSIHRDPRINRELVKMDSLSRVENIFRGEGWGI